MGYWQTHQMSPGSNGERPWFSIMRQIESTLTLFTIVQLNHHSGKSPLVQPFMMDSWCDAPSSFTGEGSPLGTAAGEPGRTWPGFQAPTLTIGTPWL